MAEREGFEPPVPQAVQLISSPFLDPHKEQQIQCFRFVMMFRGYSNFAVFYPVFLICFECFLSK